MTQRSREKAALGVLGVLVVVFVVVVVAYLFFGGRMLNVAAGNLDDSFGTLDGYLVVVYEGTLENEEADDEALTIEEVAASYEEKGADVLVLDTSDFSFYEEGLIIRCGDYRIGVFSVDIYTLRREVRAMVDYFEFYGVDYIVVLTPHSALVDDVTGIDVVVSTRDSDPGTSGAWSSRTFYVSVPSINEFGVVLISSSNTVSSKVVHEF